jgi:hypothetical protein
MSADKVRNRDRWSNETDPRDAQRLEIEAKRHGLDPVTYEMSRAVPTDLVRDLVRDGRQFYRGRSDFNRLAGDPTPTKPLEPIPLGPMAGQSLADAMCEAQARRDMEEELARRMDIAIKLQAKK